LTENQIAKKIAAVRLSKVEEIYRAMHADPAHIVEAIKSERFDNEPQAKLDREYRQEGLPFLRLCYLQRKHYGEVVESMRKTPQKSFEQVVSECQISTEHQNQLKVDLESIEFTRLDTELDQSQLLKRLRAIGNQRLSLFVDGNRRYNDKNHQYYGRVSQLRDQIVRRIETQEVSLGELERLFCILTELVRVRASLEDLLVLYSALEHWRPGVNLKAIVAMFKKTQMNATETNKINGGVELSKLDEEIK
jgi:hypothetical protein